MIVTLEAVYANNFKVAKSGFKVCKVVVFLKILLFTISDWICPTMLKHLIVFRKHARIISFFDTVMYRKGVVILMIVKANK